MQKGDVSVTDSGRLCPKVMNWNIVDVAKWVYLYLHM